MKILGLLIMIVGVAICAATGARLTPQMYEHVTITGSGGLRGEAEAGAFGAYCEARKGAGLDPADGCPDQEPEEEEEEEDEPAPEEREEPTYDGLVAQGRARLESLRASEEELPDPVAEARAEWLDAMEAAIEPKARAALKTEPPPGARLSAWWGQSGPLFLLGLVLVVAGAVLGRVAVRREARAGEEPAAGEGPYRESAKPEDFGRMLESLHDRLAEMADEMEAVEEPGPEDFERFKNGIHDLQLESFERLVDARSKVQVRYGMAGFAEIFGPLSAGERKVNRTWAALVDGHWPEAVVSLRSSVGELEQANRTLERVAG